jgi:hypothetical protein
MYVISLDHYLDAKGAIAIEKGPGRKIADFATAAVRLVVREERPSGFGGMIFRIVRSG